MTSNADNHAAHKFMTLNMQMRHIIANDSARLITYYAPNGFFHLHCNYLIKHSEMQFNQLSLFMQTSLLFPL